MIRPRRKCPECGGKVSVLRVIKKRADRTKGATDDKREAWQCDDCDTVSVNKSPKKRG